MEGEDSSKNTLRTRLLGRNPTPNVPKPSSKANSDATKMQMKLPAQKRIKEKSKVMPLPVTKDEQGTTIDALNLEIPQDREVELEISTGTIRIYCTAEKLDRSTLIESIAKRCGDDMKWFEDEVLHTRYRRNILDAPKGSVFFFDYGVMVTWGLDVEDDKDLRENVLNPSEVESLPVALVEEDEFSFIYTFKEKPCIVNDTIMLHPNPKEEVVTQIAVSHALAQSAKLAVFEDRLSITVDGIIHIPEQLATKGKVAMTGKDIAMLSGKLFLQRSAVNLLSSVLDTPDFFWDAEDHLQVLYKCTYEYLEIESRTEVLNSRFSVMHDLLDMLRDYEHNAHSTRLEWIVIWLIMVEVLVSFIEGGMALFWSTEDHEF